MSENEDLGYLEPEEGTNLWYDAMVITKNCRNTDLAHAYIDYFLRDDVAEANSLYIGYTSPILEVYEKLVEEEYTDINAYVPRVGNANDEIFAYQDPKVKKLFAELWTKVKAQ
jgi:spermidine/putrescine transport system permease protein